MPKSKRIHLITTAILLASATVLLLIASLGGQGTSASAAPKAPNHQDSLAAGSVFTVCPSGCPYSTIQSAVDASTDPDDLILVATGTYTSTSSDVVYVDKSVTIRGGYSPDFSVWDPDTYPTIIDGQNSRRGVSTGSDITPTLEALRITRGTAGGSSGGGIYVPNASPIISGCVIYSNTAAAGAGIYIINGSHGVVRNSHIFHNQASIRGGAILIYQHPDTSLINNEIYSNTGDSNGGGGVYIWNSVNAVLTGNRIYSNTSTNSAGGGIRFYYADNPVLVGNHIMSNTSNSGGGIYLAYSDNATLTDNDLISNTATDGYGGGIYADNSLTPTLTANRFSRNTQSGVGSAGGAVVLWGASAATLTDNEIWDNSSIGNNGGGVYVSSSNHVRLSGNIIRSNTAGTASAGNGGGIWIRYSDHITLTGNTVLSNSAVPGDGGGIHIDDSLYAILMGNRVENNTAGWSGGGFRLDDSDYARLDSNTFISNTATGAPGVYLRYSDASTWTNNIIANNHITYPTSSGAGINIDHATAHMVHTTVARNTGGEGQGIYINFGRLWMTNTILVGHEVGIQVEYGDYATMTHTLWGAGAWANTTNWVIDGSLDTGSDNWYEEPDFADPDAFDYHLARGSAAIDVGLYAGVDTDVDGEIRPTDGDRDTIATVDLGADEFVLHWAFLPLILRNH